MSTSCHRSVSPDQFSVIITTCASKETAESIATDLLTHKLIACAQIDQIDSFYTWNGTLAHDHEWRLWLKCKSADYQTIEQRIVNLHNYAIPEVIELPIQKGLPNYLQWIKKSCDKI